MMASKQLNKLRIGTHNGKFHADELVACAMLRMLPEYANTEIVRTRDPSELSTCAVLVDVGGVFDHNTYRYDHHQREFNLTFKDFHPESEWGIKLSSAGLVYAHYGQRILATLADVQDGNPMIPIIYHKIYSRFVVEIDAIDNGVPLSEHPTDYTITTGLSSRVGLMNPQWNEKDADETIRFMDALSMVDKEIRSVVHHYVNSWYPARDIVATALRGRFDLHPSGLLVSLEDKPCPWASHIHEMEQIELEEKQCYQLFDLSDPKSTESRPIYVIYRRDDGNWSLQSVGVSSMDAFKQRLPLPEPWRGLRDDELSKVTGIPGCVFVHSNGFLGIHKSRDGILNLALMSLKHGGLLNSIL